MEPGSLASGARMAERRQRAVSEGHGSGAARSASRRKPAQTRSVSERRIETGIQRQGLLERRWPRRRRTTGRGLRFKVVLQAAGSWRSHRGQSKIVSFRQACGPRESAAGA